MELVPACPPIASGSNDGTQPLGGAIHGGPQTGRTCTRYGEVIYLRGGSGLGPVGGRQVSEAGIMLHRAVVVDHGGKAPLVNREVLDELLPSLRFGGVELERDAVAGQQVTQLMAAPATVHSPCT